MTAPFRVYIGWDQREPIAYGVARFSLERRASIPVAVQPIKLDELRARGLYARDQDPLASTEFTYSRFLTPTLAGFKGWALFCDCDFLWLGDIAGLAAYAKGDKAVYLRASRLHTEGGRRHDNVRHAERPHQAVPTAAHEHEQVAGETTAQGLSGCFAP
jgi:hypothetical protein